MTDRISIGKINKKNGSRFENLIDYACRIYREKGIAEINKANEPIKPISGRTPGGWFKAVFTKKSGVDYSGVVKGGMAFYMEAKYTSTDRISYSRVEPQQLEQLERAFNLGAVCYILVCFASGGVYMIPFCEWQEMKKIYGRLYIKENEVECYKIAEPWENVFFLGGIVKGGGIDEL